MRSIAIIPARSGSKGLPDKNVREMCGKPLMAHTIEAAIGSGEFDEVMVSTDSERYAAIARDYGASVPFLRSVGTATDAASSWDAVAEVLEGYGKDGSRFDTFCLLQPTSPLRTAWDINSAYGLYRDRFALAVVSVCEAEHSPLWCGTLPEDGALAGFLGAREGARRQDLEKFYRVNGAIYLMDVSAFARGRSPYRKGGYAYVMDRARSIDIDDEIDFAIAEFLLEKRLREECS